LATQRTFNTLVKGHRLMAVRSFTNLLPILALLLGGAAYAQTGTVLSFIKTSNTPNGRVEVHLASGPRYQNRILETPTTFANESDGTWQLLPNFDLAFIKTSNTPNGQVEVHIAGGPNYQNRVLETPTTFANESDGTWQLLPNLDLAFIKTSNTPNGQVEVHIASSSSNYQNRILETPTTFANESDGTWQLLPNLDLAFIKTSNTPNGQVEVHIASRSSNYQNRVLETPTTFANESDGTWSIVYDIDPARPLEVSRFTTATLTDADADRILYNGSRVLWSNDGAGDVSCLVRLYRNGNVTVFNTGNGIINSQADFNTINGLPGRVKVVNQINWCGGLAPNIIGCSPIPGSSEIVVRFTTNQEGILWDHEYGHTRGLNHVPGATSIMNGTIAPTRTMVSAGECFFFRCADTPTINFLPPPFLTCNDPPGTFP
jgi:hypothetical protein